MNDYLIIQNYYIPENSKARTS